MEATIGFYYLRTFGKECVPHPDDHRAHSIRSRTCAPLLCGTACWPSICSEESGNRVAPPSATMRNVVIIAPTASKPSETCLEVEL